MYLEPFQTLLAETPGVGRYAQDLQEMYILPAQLEFTQGILGHPKWH